MKALFQPNNLSYIRPRLTPVKSGNNTYTEVTTILRRFYGITKRSSIKLNVVQGDHPLSKNILVILPHKKYVVKCRYGAITEKRLTQETLLCQRLRQKGLPLPKSIQSNVGRYVNIYNDKSCIMYAFEQGTYFTGAGRELDTAAQCFAKFTKYAGPLADVSLLQPWTPQSEFFEELKHLLLKGASQHRGDKRIVTLCSGHGKKIMESLRKARNQRMQVEANQMLLHLDYHPLNLLVRDGKVVCILDFETLRIYPVLAGLGFAAYKLIRQMLVNKHARERKEVEPSLVSRWLHGWKKFFPHLDYTRYELGLGARYRILFLIYTILHTYLNLGDDKFNYDLEKQIYSLYEVDEIFGHV